MEKKNNKTSYIEDITKLHATMDFLKEQFWEMREDLKDHIKSEDAQIQRIATMIEEWQVKHDTDSAAWRKYAEDSFVKKDALKQAWWVIGTFVTTVWVVVAALNAIHPLFK